MAKPDQVAKQPYSIIRRLSRQLILQTLVGMGLISGGIFAAAAMFIEAEEREQVETKISLLQGMMIDVSKDSNLDRIASKLAYYAPRRPGTFLEVTHADGSLLYRDGPDISTPKPSWRQSQFETRLARGEVLFARLAVDCAQTTRMLVGLGITLIVSTLVGAALVGFGAAWRVRRDLQALHVLAQQTRAISPNQLGKRLQLLEPVEELQPWIEQFNSLMERLQQAYLQLEGFNADVAHELRTPLASVMGQTELALARERSPEALRETLVSNLEEMQRLVALVNDMLFLSQADRGAVARRGNAINLADLANKVVDFHEAPLADAQLSVEVNGLASAAVDESLFKRALSNLLSNAIRYAEQGSCIVIRLAREGTTNQVRVEVENKGPAIAPQHLSRMFDRFFRVEECRSDSGLHHGLGLAIVAAIARMHAGLPMASSDQQGTRVGFTLAIQ
jgi:two-component system, OmpR family, heavy metal sensor histidine kinase CusS